MFHAVFHVTTVGSDTLTGKRTVALKKTGTIEIGTSWSL